MLLQGMVQIPSMFQQAGWLFPSKSCNSHMEQPCGMTAVFTSLIYGAAIMFVYIGGLMGIISMYLSKAVSLLPGNQHFRKRIEFNELANAVFPKWLYIITMVCLLFNFQATNISAIVVSAQTMDNTILAIAKKTCAIILYPAESPMCIEADGTSSVTDSPFGDKYVISIGYIVTLALTVPLGFINLEDNMWVQQGGFVLLVFCIFAWVAQFFSTGLSASNMPVNDFSGWGPVLSTVVFNFGFMSTIPSWLNEKAPHVSVAKASWVSVVISGVMFLVLGIFGGYSLNVGNNLDLLAGIVGLEESSAIHTTAVVACYIFPTAALLSGIPVFSIIVRYNLLSEGVPAIWANLFAVVFPWVVALAFYSGNLLSNLITWSSAVLFVLLNCTFPVLIYYVRKLEIAKQQRETGLVQVVDGGSINTGPSEKEALLQSGDGHEGEDSELNVEGSPDIHELPIGIRSLCTPMQAAKAILVMSGILAVITLALQFYSVADPNGN
jgi:hypothetical protein